MKQCPSLPLHLCSWTPAFSGLILSGFAHKRPFGYSFSPMLNIRKSSTVLIAVLVLIGLLSNTAAAAVCSHMSGNACWVPSEAAAGVSDLSSMAQAGVHEPEDDSRVNSKTSSEAAGSHCEKKSRLSVIEIKSQGESCSHCISDRSESRQPVLFAITKRDSARIAVVSSLTTICSSLLVPSDPHDHSPPEYGGPRFLLINIFRI